jgi:hypothetical protein
MQMKSIIIIFVVLALAITATKIRSQNKLSYVKDQSFKDKEASLNFLETSIHHHFKKSLEEASQAVNLMVGEYLHFEYYNSKQKFPFVEEANELRKVAHLIPILKSQSTIKSWQLDHSARFSEIKDKISESTKKLTNMLQKGKDMVRKMVSNPLPSRFMSKSLFSTFSKFVSLSSTTKVYTEFLESINLSAKMSKEIAMMAADSATTNMAKVKDKRKTTGDKTENQDCEFKWIGSECTAGLVCSDGKCKKNTGNKSKKQLMEDCKYRTAGLGSDCDGTMQCKILNVALTDGKCLKKCSQEDGDNWRGSKVLNEACEHYTHEGSECGCTLKCSSTTHTCIPDVSFVTQLKSAFSTLATQYSQTIQQGVEDGKTEKDSITGICKNQAQPNVVDTINQDQRSKFTIVLDKLKGFGEAIKTKILELFNFVKGWIAGVAIGIELEAKFTVFKGTASVNYAITGTLTDNYWYGEVCGGIQFNFGASLGAGIVVTIFHEKMTDEVEHTTAADISVKVGDAGVAEVELGFGLNIKESGGKYEVASLSIGVSFAGGKNVLPATLSHSKCVAKRFSKYP